MRLRRKDRIPGFVILVVISTVLACTFSGVMIFGFALKGYAWIIQFVLAIVILLRSPRRVSFPWYIWSPWVCLILIYIVFSPFENALQRTGLLLCPVIVGIVVSRYSIRETELRVFGKLCDYMAVFLFVFVAFGSGVALTGALPEVMGLSPQSMTCALLATIFATRYVYGRRRALYYWIGLCLIPVIALTRTAIVATGITLPATFAPFKFPKRLIVFSIIGVLGIGLFYTERFQHKMFYSGEGSLADVRYDNPNLYTTGRIYLWERMDWEISEKPWFGHGANAQEAFLAKIVGFQGQPHNDWKRLLFDYGYLGTSIFLLCLVLQVLHAWQKARKTPGELRILFYAGASSFLPLVLFMFTDNIILYAPFFLNLQFTLLGLAYAGEKTLMRDLEMYYRTRFPAAQGLATRQNKTTNFGYNVSKDKH